MYPSIVRIEIRDRSYPYLRLIESYWAQGRVKQKTPSQPEQPECLKEKGKDRFSCSILNQAF
ncbi:hypothetical protein CEE35_00180 [Candidatus Aerophobetes bacterium Ae_b3b]|nr:MAG: hypothetical protein CEE35_00180 [Candidatus Aerophobetes bacterium Ae_b3b]